MIERIFTIVAPLFMVVLVAYLYGRKRQPSMGIVNKINMEVFIPALIFSVMARDSFQPGEYVMLAIAATGVILGSGVLAWIASRLLGWQWRTLVPPMMFSNWGNLGIPLFVFAWGEESLGAAVVLFVTGNVLWFTVGRALLSGSLSIAEVIKSPILCAVFLGLLFSSLNWSMPEVVDVPLEMLGRVAIPLMLFSLGVRLTALCWEDWRFGVVGGILCPTVGVLSAWLLTLVLPLDPLQQKQVLLLGVLPPAVMNFVFAEEFNQEPGKVASIVMVANIMSMVTIPVLLFFIL